MEIITKYFSDFTPQQVDQLKALGELYPSWNEKINVISRKDIDQLYIRHVLHSLAIATICQFEDGAQVIALCSYPGGGAQALAAIRNAGVKTPVISGFGLDGAFWLGAVPNLSNFYTVTYASVFGDDPNSKVVELLAA